MINLLPTWILAISTLITSVATLVWAIRRRP
jgi:hypothetical protein